MKLYKTKYVNDDAKGNKYGSKWSTSAGAASKDRTALKKDGMREIETEEVEVDTRRDNLVTFLNALTTV